MQENLTIIYITASEIKDSFAKKQREILIEAIGDTPIICVYRDPQKIPFEGQSNVIYQLDTEKKCLSNIYFQILQAAKKATTEFVAIAEDDTLYNANHFTYRPKNNEFLYNQNRFALFTWGDPIYSWRNRKSNATLIAPRKLLIEALEERFTKWPQGTPDHITGEVGRGMVERNLKITERKSVEIFGEVSVIQFNHANASENRQRNRRKKLGQIKVYDIYYWGHAKNLRKYYED